MVDCQVFVYGGNIYFQKNPFMTPVRLTDDHSSLVRNGITNWLYERTDDSTPLATAITIMA